MRIIDSQAHDALTQIELFGQYPGNSHKGLRLKISIMRSAMASSETGCSGLFRH